MNIESLESRTLLSASAISTQIAIDRLHVKADLLQFRSDSASNDLTLFDDAQALKADGLTSDPTFKSDLETLHKAVNSMHQQLYADRLNEGANVLHDQSVIVLELIQILKDKGNPTALAADHQKLLADRVQLQTDEINGLNARIQTRETDLGTISTDASNLVTAVEMDPNASAQALIDVQKFATDRDSAITTLTSDLETIMLARTTLADALMALET
jgi:hypothetical protein